MKTQYSHVQYSLLFDGNELSEIDAKSATGLLETAESVASGHAPA
jgi:hypothetical protein